MAAFTLSGLIVSACFLLHCVDTQTVWCSADGDCSSDLLTCETVSSTCQRVACTDDNGCTMDNTYCDINDGRCSCKDGLSLINGDCQQIIGQQCQSWNDCEGNGYGCYDGECNCDPNMSVEVNGTCVSVIGQSCSELSECGHGIYTVECRDSVCACRRGYMLRNYYCTNVIGSACLSNEDCPLENAVCDGTCKCSSWTSQLVNGPQTCDIDLGQSCFDYECGFDMNNMYGTTIHPLKYCNEDNICSCRIGYVERNQTCVSAYNKDCSDALSDCGSDILYDCQDLQCQCAVGFVSKEDASLHTFCVKELGQPCANLDCSLANAACDDQEICNCISGYMERLGQCIPVIGSDCSWSGECSNDPNAVCDTNCRCKTGFEINRNVCTKIRGKNCTSDAECDETAYLLCEDGVCTCDSQRPQFKDQCLRTECHVDVEDLPFLEKRSPAYKTHAYETSLDDSKLEPRWYNLYTYNLAPPSDNIKTGSCGTLYPIYLKEMLTAGQLQLIGEGSIKTTVVAGDVDHAWPRQFDVELRKCGDSLHVLIESPPPQLSAFCIDTNVESHNSGTYNTAWSMNGAWISSELQFYEEERNGIMYDVPYIQWTCHSYIQIPDGVETYVTWKVNNSVFKTKGPKPISFWNELTEMELIEGLVATIGFKLRCSIESFGDYGELLHTHQSQTIKTGVDSELLFWQSIQIRPDNYITGYVQTPLGCARPVGDTSWNCTLFFDIIPENGTSMCRSSVSDPHENCGIFLLGTTKFGLYNGHFNSFGMLTAFIHLEDTTEKDETRIKKEVRVVPGKSTSSTGHALWQAYQLPNLNLQWSVSSSLTSSEHCSVNGVTMKRFGMFEPYTSITLQFPEVGTYLLYRNNEYPVEVQVHTEECATSNDVCVCGATVRNDDQIFTVYTCGGSHISETIMGSFSGINSDSIRLKLVDGTSVSIHVQESQRSTLSIFFSWIMFGIQTADSILLNSSEGLCMVKDGGNRKRDGTHTSSEEDFLRSWIVVTDENLLNPVTHTTYIWNERFVPCGCPSKSDEIPERYDGYTGYLKCSLVNMCTTEHRGQVAWPSTLMPDYAITTVVVHPETTILAVRCEFTGGKDSYLYKIKWNLDGNTIRTTNLLHKTDNQQMILDLEDLNNEDEHTVLDAEIVCGVAVYNATGDMLMDFYYSNAFKSVEIINNVIPIIRGADAVISLRLHVHVPFGNSLQFSLLDPDNIYDCSNSTIAVKSQTNCGEVYRGSIYRQDDDGHTADTISIPITTINDNNYSLKERFSLSIHVKARGNGAANVLTGTFKEKTTVIVSDTGYWKHRYCYVSNDPRYRTFDGMHYSSNQDANYAEFVLWRHKSLQAEIQIQTRICGVGTCSCGVSIRAGRDIFIINHCNPGDHIIGFVQNGDNVLIVRKWNENSYQIHFPHGTFVEVFVFQWWSFLVNAYVYPSPKDVGQVEGLCGNLNGDFSDDFRHRDGSLTTPIGGRWWYYSPDEFVTSWQLDRDETVWEIESLLKPNRAEDSFPSWSNANEQSVCVCPYDDNEVAVCSANEERTCTKNERTGEVLVNTNRRTRSVDGWAKDMTYRLNRMRQEMMTVGIRKREVSGTDGDNSNMTYEEALEFCNQTLMRDCALSSIKNNTSANDIPSAEECAKDMMLNPSVPWEKAVCTHVSSVIAGTVSRDKDFQDSNPETTAFIRELDRCKGNCSNNGHCVGDEECSCFEGFGCNDCSLDLTKPVEILNTQGGGVCNDRVVEECSPIRVTTQGHLPNATCKTVVKQASLGHRFEDETDEINDNCGAPHMFDIYCCWDMASVRRKRSTVDSATVFQVGFSISNDGVTFGSLQYVYILDTLCQEVIEENETAIARLKSGYCFIDGVCYSEGDISTSNPCDACQPLNSLLSWTSGTCSSTADKDTNTTTIAVVSTLVGLLVIIIIAIAVIVYKKQKRKLTPSVVPGVELFTGRRADVVSNRDNAFRRERGDTQMKTVTNGRLTPITSEDSVVNKNSNMRIEMSGAQTSVVPGVDQLTGRRADVVSNRDIAFWREWVDTQMNTTTNGRLTPVTRADSVVNQNTNVRIEMSEAQPDVGTLDSTKRVDTGKRLD